MSVLFLTVFLSLCLAGVFMVFFIIEWRNHQRSSPEQDALLPFRGEETTARGKPENPETSSEP